MTLVITMDYPTSLIRAHEQKQAKTRTKAGKRSQIKVFLFPFSKTDLIARPPRGFQKPKSKRIHAEFLSEAHY